MGSQISNLKSPPEPLGALIPDALPADRSQLSARARKASWSPKKYGDAEYAEAERVLAHWNVTFRGVAGATVAQVKNRSNARVYLRMIRAAQAEGDDFASISEGRVKAAISGYRRDVYNNKSGRWKRFREWCDAENILKYSAGYRVAKHSIEQPKRCTRETEKQAAAAKRVLEHRGWVELFVQADKRQTKTRDLLRETRQFWEGRREATPTDRGREIAARQIANLDRLMEIGEKPLSEPDREVYLVRARTAFEAWFRRPPGLRDHDRARLDGIVAVLMDFDSRKPKEPP